MAAALGGPVFSWKEDFSVPLLTLHPPAFPEQVELNPVAQREEEQRQIWAQIHLPGTTLLLRESVGCQCSDGLSNCSSAWCLLIKSSTENKIHERVLITGENNCEVLQNINQWLNAFN